MGMSRRRYTALVSLLMFAAAAVACSLWWRAHPLEIHALAGGSMVVRASTALTIDPEKLALTWGILLGIIAFSTSTALVTPRKAQ